MGSVENRCHDMSWGHKMSLVGDQKRVPSLIWVNKDQLGFSTGSLCLGPVTSP